MTTPLIVLALLFLPWAAFGWLRGDWAFGGVLGLALAFAFFALGHFAQTEAMIAMLPPWIPARRLLIWSTGLLEIAIAIALLLPRWRTQAGWLAFAVLLLFFPANIYAAMNHTGMGGHQWGPEYLLIRAPLQALLLFWAWRFAASRPRKSSLKSLAA